MSQVTHDHETKLSAHELRMYVAGLQGYLLNENWTRDQFKKIETEIYYTNLLIQVREIGGSTPHAPLIVQYTGEYVTTKNTVHF